MKIIDGFMKYKKDELLNMARSYKLKGYSKLNKAELAKMVSEYAAGEGYVKEQFDRFGGDDFKMLEELADGKAFDSTSGRVAEIYNKSYLVGIENDKFVMYEETAKTFRECYTGDVKQNYKKVYTVKRYCDALTKLYGIITRGDIFEIYNRQNNDLSREEFYREIKKATDMSDGWLVMEDDVINSNILMSGKLDSVIESQVGIKRYIPTAKEIAKIADGTYFTEQQSVKNLITFTENNTDMSKEKIQSLAEETEKMCRYEIGDTNISEILKKYTIKFNKEQKKEFDELCNEISINSRKCKYSGYTEKEIQSKKEKELDFSISMDGLEYFEEISPVYIDKTIRNTHKVGRNEPCPCGSGKKYKKCCGR